MTSFFNYQWIDQISNPKSLCQMSCFWCFDFYVTGIKNNLNKGPPTYYRLLTELIDCLWALRGPIEPTVAPRVKRNALGIDDKYIAIMFEGIVSPGDFCDCLGENCSDSCAFDSSLSCQCLDCNQLVRYVSYMYRRNRLHYGVHELLDNL